MIPSWLARLRLLACLGLLAGAAGGAGAVLFSCGDGLVERSYRGQPLFSFEGQLQSLRLGPDDPNQEQPLIDESLPDVGVRLSIFWSPTQETKGVPPGSLLQQSSLAVSVSFPAAFRVDVFHLPPDSLLEGDRLYAIGLILLYTDRGDDGRFDSGVDSVIGWAESTALLYAPRTLSREQSPTGIVLPAGFNLVRLPMPCTPGPLPLDPNHFDLPDCNLPLGGTCDGDAGCGSGGVCLKRNSLAVFSGGYCSLRETDRPTCMPRSGAIIRTENQELGYWYRACVSDRDCARPGYVCWPTFAICVPDAPVALSITGREPDFVDRCYPPQPPDDLTVPLP